MERLFRWPVVIIVVGMAFIVGQKFYEFGLNQESYQAREAAKAEQLAALCAGSYERFGTTLVETEIPRASACAEQGYLDAQQAMAAHFFADFSKAEKWLLLAAQQGDGRLQARLAMHYNGGMLVEENLAEAFKWATLSAEQGYVASQSILSRFYSSGRGGIVSEDLVLAYMWMELSRFGDHIGRVRKERVAKRLAGRMTANQIAQAERMAREWIDDHPERNN
jgi:TPR repeat protein